MRWALGAALLAGGLLVGISCSSPTFDDLIAGKRCDPSGACAPGHVCDPPSQTCLPGSSSGGGAGGAAGATGGSDPTGCSGDADCTSGEICKEGACIPESCDDGTLGPGETDIDCGGSSCPPCDDGMSCVEASDCSSMFCEPVRSTCEPCTDITNCATGETCDEGKCVVGLILGDACDASTSCLSQYCSDDVCCDLACDQPCMACASSMTGVSDGICAPILGGIDPNDDCATPNTFCDGAGSCAKKAVGLPCAARGECASAFCVDGVCCGGACV
ncbi:MAG: hypothetical protein RIF41_21455, partial [Polyangiaceae bacterium]